ncbi:MULTISPECIES: restriction endonuclease subunit S, partial [Helicobacter]|uniref:restriction endonuclease subunit S n=1 Tax=Helicobacter TaxID=209 RepID=UPI0026F30586
SWAWARIQNISESYIGLTYKPSDIVNENGYIVLRSSNIKDGKLDLSDIVRVDLEISDKLKVQKNDIIICARNGSKKLVGKSAIVDVDMPNLTFGAFMAICKTPYFQYVSQYLQSNLFFNQLAKVSGTTTINQLTQASFNSFLIPIPPLAEQKCIADKINEIFAKL